MIDLQSAYVRAVLESTTQRMATAAEALDWADGTQNLNPLELAPRIATDEDRQAWERFRKQAQSVGPRAFAFKRTSAVGSINWGGDNTANIDERLETLDLERLAVKSLKNLVATGVAGLLPHQPEDPTAAPRLQRLGGHLEPLYAEDDVDGEPAAWLQVLPETSASGVGRHYRLRVYTPDPADPTRGALQEWRNARAPYEIGTNPSSVWEGVLMPTVVMSDTDQAGNPLGELAQALPLLKAEVAQQVRISRAGDANAYPLRWMTGDWDLPTEVSAVTVLVSANPESKIGVISPPDLDTLFKAQDRALERIRADLKLPISSITTGDFPSGEALEQANSISISTALTYARLLSQLLTGGVAGYAELLGMNREDAPPVAVEINREQTRRVITEQTREDYKAGLISREAAILTVAQYYPAWDDKDVQAFIDLLDHEAHHHMVAAEVHEPEEDVDV